MAPKGYDLLIPDDQAQELPVELPTELLLPGNTD